MPQLRAAMREDEDVGDTKLRVNHRPSLFTQHTSQNTSQRVS